VHLDFRWGLDHGAWSVLCRMFPGADIPVLQWSLDFDQPPAFHYQMGQKLKYLRRRGVLVIGSGNMVHNLGAMVRSDTAFDWALDFDAQLADRIAAGDHPALVSYETLGAHADLAVPTTEHYLPLLYVLGMQETGEAVSFFCDRVTFGSVSMRSVKFG
jgi:4,5-DOPA dioxygenase extradiol